jgi:lipopolysaccharide export LptBFGC system permease protein LptF
MPVARPVDASEFLYLIPQAIPIAVPNGLLIAIVLGVRASLSSRLILSILSLAAICSVVSFLTLGWWAPASSQWYRTRVIGHDVARSENELTLGELGTRIDQIRAFDPDAPAIRLSVLYHNRWALSATPLIVAAFAVLIAGRNRRSPVGRVFWAVLSAGAFTLLLVWMNALAFRGSLSPPLGAWMANLSLLAVTSALMTDVLKRAADHVEKVAR